MPPPLLAWPCVQATQPLAIAAAGDRSPGQSQPQPLAIAAAGDRSHWGVSRVHCSQAFAKRALALPHASLSACLMPHWALALGGGSLSVSEVSANAKAKPGEGGQGGGKLR